MVRGILAATSVTVVLLLISPFVPTYGHWVVDNGAKYLQLVSIAGDNQFREFDIVYPARQVDPSIQAAPMSAYPILVQEERLYTQYPPAFAWLTASAYKVVGDWATRLAPLLGAVGIWAAAWWLGVGTLGL